MEANKPKNQLDLLFSNIGWGGLNFHRYVHGFFFGYDNKLFLDSCRWLLSFFSKFCCHILRFLFRCRVAVAIERFPVHCGVCMGRVRSAVPNWPPDGAGRTKSD